MALIDKVNTINKTIKEKEITDPKEINELYTQAGLPVYMNEDRTVIPTFYRRFGVLNGTAIDNAFGADFVANKYLKEIEDEDVPLGSNPSDSVDVPKTGDNGVFMNMIIGALALVAMAVLVLNKKKYFID
jgi:LPXTG-motif cell wall-anchored protein